MAEIIGDGAGSGHLVKVSESGALIVGAVTGTSLRPLLVTDAGELITSATVTATTPTAYEVSGILVNTGSVNLFGAVFNGSVFATRIDAAGSHLMIAGSISSMPSITVTNDSVIAIGSQSLGSGALIGGISDPTPGSFFPLRMFAGSALMIGGSVSTYSPAGVGSTIASGITSVTGSVELIDANGTSPLFDNNRFAGSIVSLPSITTTNDSVIAMGSQSLGSATLIAGITDPTPGSVYPLRLIVGSALMIGGSVSTYGPVGVGSFVGSGVTTVTGSIIIYDSVAGSLHTIGSTQIYGELPTGSVHNIGSIEVFQQTATNLEVNATQVTDPWTVDGTVNLGTTWTGVGSIIASGITEIRGVTGSVHNIGSIEVYGGITASDASVGAIGSITLGSMSLVGGIFGVAPGSYVPLRIFGGSYLGIGGSVSLHSSETGSVHNIGSIGVFGLTGSLHSIGSTQVYSQELGSVHNIGSIEIHGQLETGSVHNIGSIETFQATATEGIGSIRLAAVASDIVDPIQVEQNRGVFRYSGATITGSVIGSYLITAGAGSKLLLKGFNASCEVATQFRIIYSGLTPDLVSTFSIPNSGTVAMNMIGMEPSGIADRPIGIGLSNAGSVHITFFTEDTL